ncbi:aspartate/glutamate racemase family protein [Alphaproteobacteria bacterium]|nr:aspartate/glutamate racemase family protein [Alphaproteobacteria bacterium]
MTNEIKKILVIVPFPMSKDEISNRENQSNLVSLDKKTKLYYNSVKASPRTYVSEEDYVLADISILEAGLQAEKDGFDGICIDTVSDSGLSALRSVLDIPVVGPGKLMYLTSLMLGEKFSIIAMWKEWFGLYKKILTEMNLLNKCASMRSIDLIPDNRNLLDGKEDDIFPMLLDIAKKCIEIDGADVICLGSTTMHQAHGWLSEKLSVPIINPGPLSYKILESMIKLKLTHSRKTYPNPKVPRHDMIHTMLNAAAKADLKRPLDKIK